MEKKYDVAAMGELLIDFAMNGQSEQGNNCFEACPGGAPCNVLAMLGKLGRKTVFLGKVGEDQFGKLLKETIEEVGVDTTGLRMDQEIPTTLAFVHTFPDGDRDFSFYRKPGADMMLREEEVDYDVIRQAKIFHFGTLSMTDEPVRSAHAPHSPTSQPFLTDVSRKSLRSMSVRLARTSTIFSTSLPLILHLTRAYCAIRSHLHSV